MRTSWCKWWMSQLGEERCWIVTNKEGLMAAVKVEGSLGCSDRADNIRKYWSRYYQGSQGVIFVLDSASSEDDLETARNELHSALQHPQLCTLPFLILANHQDKPAARSVQE
ncbi:PREDICTED: ADP-ribosylation factor-like protein 15, partial [Apaloderma vittatum]|uniref:ADP-ribosylation factor-like protein 15 n=1 Tax=Apaloderma vittatum TaxID=57397 RepID=UPI0005211DD2